MKIAVIGGAGVRIPLLVNGLASAALGIDEFALYDPDQDRLAVIADLARRRSGSGRVTAHASSAPAIDGASFVIISIRVGGMAARIRDERAALDLGFVGQETVGPGGFAMAVRTIPPLVDYAREVMQRAPQAWIINFTNPAGLVTQALTSETGARVTHTHLNDGSVSGFVHDGARAFAVQYHPEAAPGPHDARSILLQQFVRFARGEDPV